MKARNIPEKDKLNILFKNFIKIHIKRSLIYHFILKSRNKCDDDTAFLYKFMREFKQFTKMLFKNQFLEIFEEIIFFSFVKWICLKITNFRKSRRSPYLLETL